MAETKHTPKWRKDNWITESNQECTVIIEDGTHGVTHVAIVYADEDANLIVNAPTLQSRIEELEAEKAELVEALIRAKTHFEIHIPNYSCSQVHIDICKAIAKVDPK